MRAGEESIKEPPFSDLIFKPDAALAWLRWLRRKQGISQQTLESLADISQSEIHRIENHQQEVRLSSFVKICSELGVPPGWMLDVMIESNVALFAQRISPDPDFANLLAALKLPVNGPECSSAQNHLASACVLAGTLLRCSAATRRVAVVGFPSDDIRHRFFRFAGELERAGSPIERLKDINDLRARPVSTLDRLNLISRETLQAFAKRRASAKGGADPRSLAWAPWVMTFDDLARMLDLPGEPWSPGKKELTPTSTSDNNPDTMKARWPALKKRLQTETAAPGARASLAKYVGVADDLTRISQWLSDSDNAREPKAEYALRMKEWLENPKVRP